MSIKGNQLATDCETVNMTGCCAPAIDWSAGSLTNALQEVGATIKVVKYAQGSSVF
jgi:hypothetical protein